jgi:hypothetical protein
MKIKTAIAAMCLLVGGPVFACTYPMAPSGIPNGKTADKDTMLAKKKEIDKYKREVEVYLSCESNPLKAQSAQNELDRVANRFNSEVRAFKAANGG